MKRTLTINVAVPVSIEVTVSDEGGDLSIVSVHNVFPPAAGTIHESMGEDDYAELDRLWAAAGSPS